MTDIQYPSEADASHVNVPMYHHNLVEVVKSAFADPSAAKFHWKGFTQHWKPSEDEEIQHVYSEAYTVDFYHEMEAEITPPPGCTLETTVAAIGVYSDQTKLTNFGDAVLWPAYISFLNLTKYIVSKPSSFSVHHIAYFPSVRVRSWIYV